MSKFAVFDIDGTLIRWQLYHVLVDKLAERGALGDNAKELLHESRMSWKRRENPDAFKQYEKTLVKMYESAVHNLSTEMFDEIVTKVIDEYKDQTYVYTRNLAKQLKNEGYFMLIISGSHHELIEQIGKYYGFDDWRGATYVRAGTGFSGEKNSPVKDKKAALEEMVAAHKLSNKDSVAIGDSASDISMLELVDNPIAFNPDRTLLKTARENNWPVVVERKNVIYNLKPQNGTYQLDIKDD